MFTRIQSFVVTLILFNLIVDIFPQNKNNSETDSDLKAGKMSADGSGYSIKFGIDVFQNDSLKDLAVGDLNNSVVVNDKKNAILIIDNSGIPNPDGIVLYFPNKKLDAEKLRTPGYNVSHEKFFDIDLH